MTPVISFSRLGRWGRFGNMLFEYMFIRTYALKHGIGYECPEWLGQHIFGLTDPPLSGEYPLHHEKTYNLDESVIANAPDPPKHSMDVAGVFQYHTSYYRPWQKEIRDWFTFRPEPKLDIDDRDIIAIHLRRGDYRTYQSGFAFIPPNQWYIDWLHSVWHQFNNPLLYIATDEPGEAMDFQQFNPKMAVPSRYSFYQDFYVLCQAKAMAISNSSFSFVAAMLNTKAREFVRPRLDRGVLTPGGLFAFDPWDDEPLLHRDRKPVGIEPWYAPPAPPENLPYKVVPA